MRAQRRRRPLLLALAWLAAAALPSSAAADWKRALEAPPTPGSLVLLVEHGRQPAVRERWVEGLRHARAEVRAAAARAIYASGARALAPDLLQALSAERDLAAAREQMLALAHLGGGDALDTMIAAASRLGGSAGAWLAECLARAAGTGVIELLPRLAPLMGEERSEFALAASAGETGALMALAKAALAHADFELWRACLDAALEARVDVDPALLTAGLRAESPKIRSATVWFLLLCSLDPLPPDLRTVIEAMPEAGEAGGDPGVRFALELLRRSGGAKPLEDPGLVAQLRDPDGMTLPFSLLRKPRAARHLTEAELRAFSFRNSGDEKALDDFWKRAKESGTETPSARPRQRIRTLGPLPRGVAREALAMGGCAATKDVVRMAGEVRYGRDGRPTGVSLATVALTASCMEALRALYLAALPPALGWTPLPVGDMVLTRLEAPRPACEDEAPAPSPARVGGRRGRARIQEPKKLHNVDPIYPEAAKNGRIQGIVVLDAMISPRGCMEAVQVVRSVHPALDAQALDAASQWRYTPTLLDGVAVPVVMTITVNFRLN